MKKITTLFGFGILVSQLATASNLQPQVSVTCNDGTVITTPQQIVSMETAVKSPKDFYNACNDHNGIKSMAMSTDFKSSSISEHSYQNGVEKNHMEENFTQDGLSDHSSNKMLNQLMISMANEENQLKNSILKDVNDGLNLSSEQTPDQFTINIPNFLGNEAPDHFAINIPNFLGSDFAENNREFNQTPDHTILWIK